MRAPPNVTDDVAAGIDEIKMELAVERASRLSLTLDGSTCHPCWPMPSRACRTAIQPARTRRSARAPTRRCSMPEPALRGYLAERSGGRLSVRRGDKLRGVVTAGSAASW